MIHLYRHSLCVHPFRKAKAIYANDTADINEERTNSEVAAHAHESVVRAGSIREIACGVLVDDSDLNRMIINQHENPRKDSCPSTLK
jgi:hypothetical protein